MKVVIKYVSVCQNCEFNDIFSMVEMLFGQAKCSDKMGEKIVIKVFIYSTNINLMEKIWKFVITFFCFNWDKYKLKVATSLAFWI